MYRTTVASELWGLGGTLYPQVQDLYLLYLPSQRCGLCQNFKQTTLTTRLHKVRTNLYPQLRKRSDAPAEQNFLFCYMDETYHIGGLYTMSGKKWNQ